MPVDSEIRICPNEQQLLELFAGNLPVAVRARMFAHVLDCDQCRAAMKRAGIKTSALAAAGADSHPDTLTQPPPHSRGTDAHSGGTQRKGSATDDFAGGQEIASRVSLAPAQGPDELGRLGIYRILRVLGEGGMGIVFEAEDTTLARRVAIKVLRNGELDPAQRKRFLQEAQLAA